MKNATRLLSFAILFRFANIILLSTAKLIELDWADRTGRVREDARDRRNTNFKS